MSVQTARSMLISALAVALYRYETITERRKPPYAAYEAGNVGLYFTTAFDALNMIQKEVNYFHGLTKDTNQQPKILAEPPPDFDID